MVRRKRNWWRIVAIVLMLVVLVAWLAVEALKAYGVVYCETASIPKGIYWPTRRPPEKGDYVMFDMAGDADFDMAFERRYVRPGRYLLKRVEALGGDFVTVGVSGVSVNGQTLPKSLPMAFDGRGREMPALVLEGYELKPGEMLIMSGFTERSFDARYFGPKSASRAKWAVRPLWVWGDDS